MKNLLLYGIVITSAFTGCKNYDEFQLIDYESSPVSYVEERIYYTNSGNRYYPLEKTVEVVNSDNDELVLKSAQYGWDFLNEIWQPVLRTHNDSDASINFVVREGIWDYYNREDIDAHISTQFNFNPTTGMWEELFKWETDKDESGILKSMIGYSWDSLISDWSRVSKLQFEYNQENEKTQELQHIWNEDIGDWELNRKRDITLDGEGNEINVVDYRWVHGSWIGIFQNESNFNINNKATKTTITRWVSGAWQNYATLNYTYDSENYLIDNIIRGWDANSGRWLISGKYTYKKIYSRR